MENTNISDAMEEQNKTARFIDDMKSETERLNKAINELKEGKLQCKKEYINNLFDSLKLFLVSGVLDITGSIKNMEMIESVISEMNYVRKEVLNEIMRPL